MNNKKGFSLIELMAAIVILGILLTLAVPNTLSMLDRNKKDSFIEDAKKFLSEAQAEVLKNKRIEKPKDETSATIVTMKYLATNSLETSSYGVNYDPEKSFVVITRSSGREIYYINLIACDDVCSGSNVVGLNVVIETDLNKDNSVNLVKKGDVVTDYVTYNSLVGTYEAGAHLRNKIGNRVVNYIY